MPSLVLLRSPRYFLSVLFPLNYSTFVSSVTDVALDPSSLSLLLVYEIAAEE
jgi:hypothetical protein